MTQCSLIYEIDILRCVHFYADIKCGVLTLTKKQGIQNDFKCSAGYTHNNDNGR